MARSFRNNRVIPFRKSCRRKSGSSSGFVPVVLALSLATFSAAFFWDGGPAVLAVPTKPSSTMIDPLNANFSTCGLGRRITCVVDGDTIWLEGTKIRIADINTPETSNPDCPAEKALGNKATMRLVQLLNQAPFDLASVDRNEDRYGRKLRIITRGGQSLGDQLVHEGLAEEWNGRRRNWC